MNSTATRESISRLLLALKSRSKKAELRYYLYISDAKVNMLLPQVPGALQRKVSAKFGFDIKVLSGSLETERATLDNRIARLGAVEEYVVQNEQVGTPSSPASWIHGIVDAKFLDIGNGAILFLAGDRSSILALGGSARHVIGAASEPVQIPMSFAPNFVGQLTSLIDKRPDWLLGMDEADLRRSLDSETKQRFERWAGIISWAYQHAEAHYQRIEFLAKRLVTTEVLPGEIITLSTPLYVSYAD